MDTKLIRGDDWFSRLNAFHKLVRSRQRLQLIRTLLYSGLLLSICNLLFILLMAPRSGFLITFPLVLLPLMLLLSPLVSLWLSGIEKKRNALARHFFQAGMRVDDAGRLITNAAHPQVVAEPTKKSWLPRLMA